MPKCLIFEKYNISGIPEKIGPIRGMSAINIGINPRHATANVTAK
jgi:hypothetical protein